MPGYPPTAASLVMFTTSPWERVRRGRASRTKARGASTFTSNTWRNRSRSASTRGGSGDSPRSEALLARNPARTRPRPRLAPVITATLAGGAFARAVRAVEGVIGTLHGAPEYIYSKVYKFDKP